MTSTRESTAREMLVLLGVISRRLKERAVGLRKEPGVSRVVHSVDITEYRSGMVVEGYLDCEFNSRPSLSWCFDVRWTPEKWIINASLNRSADGGQQLIGEVSTKEVEGVDSLSSELLATVETLLTKREE